MDKSIRCQEEGTMSALTACPRSALQVLLDEVLRPEDLCQEQLAEATLQAYLLAPCPDSSAAALTLLACTQPSCKHLKRLEVNATHPHDLQCAHAIAGSVLLGFIVETGDEQAPARRLHLPGPDISCRST